jgi:WD40 repeat protein
MEVKDITDFEDEGAFRVRRVAIRLNTNMISMTIEKLLEQRKQQVAELCGVVAKDLGIADRAADIPTRTRKAAGLTRVVSAAASATYNDNAKFSAMLGEALELMPKCGDEIQLLPGHTRDIYGLVSMGGNASFASSSWDGTARLWTLDDDDRYSSVPVKLPAASLSLARSGDETLASGQFDGTVTVQDISSSSSETEQLSKESLAPKPVTALAYAGSAEPGAETAAHLASGSMDGKIDLWLNSTLVQTVGGGCQKGLEEEGHSKVVSALVWADSLTLISASFDQSVAVWKLQSEGQLAKVATVSLASAATSLVNASHGFVVIGCEDGSVTLWNTRDHTSKDAHETVATHSSGVCSLALLTNPLHNAGGEPSTWVACGLGDGTIVVTDTAAGYQNVATMHGHGAGVHALLWLEGKGWLVSGAGDATIRVWRVR